MILRIICDIYLLLVHWILDLIDNSIIIIITFLRNCVIRFEIWSERSRLEKEDSIFIIQVSIMDLWPRLIVSPKERNKNPVFICGILARR